jgi:hypothetical protein
MIAAQPPSLPIFISAQTVPGADMSSQCPPSVAAIKTGSCPRSPRHA